MGQRFRAVACVGCLSLMVACSPVDESAPEQEIGTARLAQLDPDYRDWRLYTLVFENEEPFAELLVIGDEEVGDYKADTEYWFVETSGLPYLGYENLEVTYQSGDGEPPAVSGTQEFSQPVYLTWQAFTTDPQEDVGRLHSYGNHHLRIKEDNGEVFSVTWYQTISTQSPQNITPNGRFEPAGSSVSVPSGQYGYYIHAVIE